MYILYTTQATHCDAVSTSHSLELNTVDPWMSNERNQCSNSRLIDFQTYTVHNIIVVGRRVVGLRKYSVCSIHASSINKTTITYI